MRVILVAGPGLHRREHDPGPTQPGPGPRRPGDLHQPLSLVGVQLSCEHLGLTSHWYHLRPTACEHGQRASPWVISRPTFWDAALVVLC